MKIAITEAKKAYNKGDVPVGAVIVYKDKVISKAYNKKEIKNNAVKHAELEAIEKACKKLKTWHLEECKLYTTLEPCMMCTGAILQSRIKYICYSTKNPNFGEINHLKKYDESIKIIKNVLHNESSDMLKRFFKEKRN